MTSLRTTCPGCSAQLRIRNRNAVGRRIRCPRCRTDFVAAVAASAPLPKSSPAGPTDVSLADKSASAPNSAPVIQTDELPSVASKIRRRKTGKKPFTWIAFCLIGTIGASVWWIVAPNRTPNASDPRQKAAQSVPDAVAANVPTAVDMSAEFDPISLDYIPVVPQLLLHIHPAKLWSDAEPYRQFTRTLGNSGTWLKSYIETSTRFNVSEIAALTIAVNFGSRGSEPDVAMLVRTVDEYPESQLLQKRIRGTMVPDLNGEVIESGDFGWMIVDVKTVAMATAELAKDLAESQQYPAVPSAQMEAILRVSNRSHLASLFADLQVLDAHKDLILVEQLHQIAESAMLWFLPDTGTLSWSMQLEPHLTMETRLAPTATSTAAGLQRRMQSQLTTLPEQLTILAESLTPRTAGHKKIVGRFPAMMQALQMGTQVAAKDGTIVMKTVLPQKAAANLAAGTMLTWNQTVVQADADERLVGDVMPNGTTPLAEQLRRDVLVDFRRTPLLEAIEYLGQSLDVPLKIDGDALMLAGFTQNMPQTHDLGTVTVLEALNAILIQYEGRMVIARDQAETSLLLTTDTAVGDRTILKTD